MQGSLHRHVQLAMDTNDLTRCPIIMWHSTGIALVSVILFKRVHNEIHTTEKPFDVLLCQVVAKGTFCL